ncbi:MAG: single-stranded DNA-binding protein [Zetaproteobacteria bacterium CG_4_9_14_3_um_filter_49_83]|nr:MAG: single-stranded DNA-binding protein [Zetaproteobacteria bacterium CG1_02_49_23]PIQ32499.1 MAG: single-stranded DNA-binding protein [Zetaproteobacteria bacterium CG17_big_fil_post_rev_8_21_14_2_50_50_13]PIV29579.1 MAG: single-stranded DNA-binding protein [Zetaproteobacteria bacterium CG02_land_8_20_14_3_00_50_9]PIY56839.1 MAG: single-stranded DNA-binding protein [Zetaproteobacteria bacterium CG_4_10_14_0_8_um_filter_49_80]PJA34157.1 MAG: single-stranded DNA-binding protein [Zetaproteobac
MLNKVMLIGNLGLDPETRFTQDGTCVCNLRIATTEKFKSRSGEQQERTEWHRVVLWGRLGEIANQYLKKGARVYIEGKIETRKWQNKDGQDQYTTEIRAAEMKMLGGSGQAGGSMGGGGQGGGGQSGGYSRNEPSNYGNNQYSNNQQHNDPFADSPDFGDIPVDDDIPF